MWRVQENSFRLCCFLKQTFSSEIHRQVCWTIRSSGTTTLWKAGRKTQPMVVGFGESSSGSFQGERAPPSLLLLKHRHISWIEAWCSYKVGLIPLPAFPPDGDVLDRQMWALQLSWRDMIQGEAPFLFKKRLRATASRWNISAKGSFERLNKQLKWGN